MMFSLLQFLEKGFYNSLSTNVKLLDSLREKAWPEELKISAIISMNVFIFELIYLIQSAN